MMLIPDDSYRYAISRMEEATNYRMSRVPAAKAP
jgi:hypothetical protein